MADREKVMKALEACLSGDPDLCVECPYFTGRIDCSHKMETDALALLREQEPVKAKILKNALTINYKKYTFAGMCPVCNSLLLRHWVACPTCGKAVKWDD